QQAVAQGAQQRESQLQSEVANLRSTNTVLERDKAALAATLEQEREQEQKLKHAFQSLATEALQANSRQFITLAEATLKTQQETAKGNLGELVTPVKTALTNVEKKLQDMEVARQGAYSSLLTQVQTLQ